MDMCFYDVSLLTPNFAIPILGVHSTNALKTGIPLSTAKI